VSPAERIARSRLARLDEGLTTWLALGRPEVAEAALDGARAALSAWRDSLPLDCSDTGAWERYCAAEAVWRRAESRLLGLPVEEAEPVRVSLDGSVVLAGGAEGVRARVAAAVAGAPKVVGRRAA
jgi:hypothetical protein